MEKAKFLAAIESFKDRPFEIGIDGSSDFTVYGNIEGRWVFMDGDLLVAVTKNVPNGRYDIGQISQREKPFAIFKVNIDDVIYVKSYIELPDIDTDLSSADPIGTSTSKDDIIKALQGDSINKSKSTITSDMSHGNFKGSVISTTIDGVDSYYKNL